MAMKERDKKMELLSRESMVEVTLEEERFKGAWFPAKILEQGKRKGKILVEYQTLFSGSNNPLTEWIDIAFVRPIPPSPPPDQAYQPHDVVDAFHRRGWWKGVVSKVDGFEGETRSTTTYTVVLENPPQSLSFPSANLRFRLLYIGGKWVRPPNQKRMKGLKIDKGMAVEVKFSTGNLQDAWFPAIVVEEVGFNSFLVEYYRSTNDGHTKETETVDSFHIQTPPPRLDGRNFTILESVEAFHDSCWKKGTIVTILTQGRYEVFLESEKEEMQFHQSEIRLRLVQKNGRWVVLRETPSKIHCKEQSTQANNVAKHSKVVVSDRRSSTDRDHSEERPSSKKMSDAIGQREENSIVKKLRSEGEKKNVSQGTPSETDFEDCENKAVTDLENRGVEEDKTETFNRSSEVMNRRMPFIKISSFWKYVDCLDVFRFLPQKPHFSPLFECHETTREGLAIGHMLVFSSLVEKASELQVETCRKVYNGYLEALADLELLGFDVKAVVERINKLLSIKTRKEQLKIQSEDVYIKIALCDGEKEKTEVEINEIDKIISELKANRASTMSSKARKESEINVLQMDADRINGDIKNTKLEFEREATTPW